MAANASRDEDHALIVEATARLRELTPKTSSEDLILQRSDEELESIIAHAVDEAIGELLNGRQIDVSAKSVEILRALLWRALGTVFEALVDECPATLRDPDSIFTTRNTR